MKPTHAMVLAAGMGTRMQPLTSFRPKPTLPVLNRPLIAHVLESLFEQGIVQAVINAHYLPEILEREVRRWLPPGMKVAFSRERSILGTAGGLRKVARHFRGGTFLLVNSDSLSDFDLGAAAAAHEESGRLATLVVRVHEPEAGYRPVKVASSKAEASRLTGIAGRSWSGDDGKMRTFIGIHLMEPALLDSIPASGACDINADIYPGLLDRDPDAVGAWLHEGWWFEAGSPSRYLELNMQMLDRMGRESVVGPEFFIDDDAKLGHSVLGRGARLDAGADARHSVLWDNVTVGRGASLRHCIVADGVEIGPGTEWAHCIISKSADGGLDRTPLEKGSE